MDWNDLNWGKDWGESRDKNREETDGIIDVYGLSRDPQPPRDPEAAIEPPDLLLPFHPLYFLT